MNATQSRFKQFPVYNRLRDLWHSLWCVGSSVTALFTARHIKQWLRRCLWCTQRNSWFMRSLWSTNRNSWCIRSPSCCNQNSWCIRSLSCCNQKQLMIWDILSWSKSLLRDSVRFVQSNLHVVFMPYCFGNFFVLFYFLTCKKTVKKYRCVVCVFQLKYPFKHMV